MNIPSELAFYPNGIYIEKRSSQFVPLDMNALTLWLVEEMTEKAADAALFHQRARQAEFQAWLATD